MANRGTSSAKEFKSASEKIATATLAYHLASDEVKPAVTTLFGLVADYVYQQEPVAEKQAIYSKTLLGVRSAKAVEHWVTDNRELLLSLDSNEDWLATIWTLFTEQLDDKFFHSVMPEILSIQLALMWMHGHAYRELFEYSRVEEGTKSWGESRRRVTEDDIISFCENTLGYECSLILAAVAEFLFGENGINEGGAEALALFQKALKYGLPDWLSISCYERGFADRVIAQHLCDAAKAGGFSGKYFVKGLVPHRKRIEAVLKDYPSYFETVLAGLL